MRNDAGVQGDFFVRQGARGLAALAVVIFTVTLMAPQAGAREVIAYFGTEVGSGSRGGEFDAPADIAVNTSGAGPANPGDVYVIDAGNDRVQRFAQDDNGTPEPFDDSFTFVAAWGADVDGSGPKGTDYEVCTVAAQCKGGLASGGNGTAGGNGVFGNLTEDSGVAVDQETGNVFVADTSFSGNNRVNIYTGDGTFLRSFGYDVAVSGPGDTGYEICVAANGDICKAGVAGNGVGQINRGGGLAVTPPDGSPATGTVFVVDRNNLRVNAYSLGGSALTSFGSAAELGNAPFDVAVDSRRIVYISYNDSTGGGGHVVARYDSQDVNGGGVGFLTPIVSPPLAESPGGNRQISGLEVDPDSDSGGPDADVLYVLRNLQPNPDSVVQQFGPVNAPGLTAPPTAEDVRHGSAAGFNVVGGLGLDDRTGRLFVATNSNIAGPSSLPEDNHGVYVLDTAGDLPTATLDSLSAITSSGVTMKGTIDPNGPPAVSYRAEYSRDGSTWTRGPEVVLGTQSDPQTVNVALEPPGGLLPGTLYHVRLVATKRFATPVISNELTFTTSPSPALVETVGSPVRSATTAMLNGRVNPRLSATQFHFEYVSATQFAASGFAGAQSTPTETVGVNEVQRIFIRSTTSGQFILTFAGESTPALPFDATPAAVQSALEALPAIADGNVRVLGGGTANPTVYVVVFTGDLAATDVSDIVASNGPVPLDDDAGGLVTTVTQGGGGSNEVQQLTIKADTGSYRLAFGSQTTQPIQFSAPPEGPESVKQRLGALSSVGGGANLAVSGGPGNPSGGKPYLIEFKGTLANKDVGALSVSDHPLEPLELLGERRSGSDVLPRITAETSETGGPANLSRLVSAQISGLSPSTSYIYRVVADNGNAGSPAVGEARTVTTRASDAPLGHGDFPGPTGSDRAYEQVNLPDTGGNPVTGVGPFAESGDRAVYAVTGGTPVSETGTEVNQHFSERTQSGWQTLDIFPSRADLLGADLSFIGHKADLSSIYIANSLAGGATSVWRLGPGVAPAKLWGSLPGQIPSSDTTGIGILPRVAPANDRLATMLRGSNLDPAFPTAGAVDNIYEVRSGSDPRLLSLMPDGGLAACGTANALGTQGFLFTVDGAALIFSSEGDGPCSGSGTEPELYIRDIDAGQTSLISGPPKSGPACGAALIRATEKAAFFFTQSRLAEEDTPASPGCPQGSDGDVYRYDLSSGAADCVTCLTVAAGVDADVNVPFNFGIPSPRSTIAVAEDGSRVYFQSSRSLLPGTPSTSSLYVTEPASGELRWVGPVDFGQTGNDNAMTPDGAVIRFRSDELALNPVGGPDNGGSVQDYRYDDRDRSLVCVSCPQDGSRPRARVSTLDQAALSDDGNLLAFATPTPLVGADQNTASPGEDPAEGMDVYEWRDGRLFLVTDGLTKWPREFESPRAAGISPSGQDLYFLAAARLTPDALDGYRRLYTARIGGGIVFPRPPQPCPLEVCQGTPRGAPEKPRPGTADFRGAGNPVRKARRCPKGKRKVRRKGTVRCVKRSRRAHHGRRAAR